MQINKNKCKQSKGDVFMAKKVWYEIQVECVSYNLLGNLQVGEKMIVAKVRSLGNAYIVRNTLETIYRQPYYKVEVLE